MKENGKHETRINIENFPSVKIHLDNFSYELKKRTDKGKTPYNLRNCAYIEDFNKPKIIFPAIMSGGSYFTHDQKRFFVLAPGNIITGDNLKSLNVYIQSIGYFALRKFYMGGGIEGELKVNRLEMLPIPPIISDKMTESEFYDLLKLTKKEIEEIINYNNSK
jgi:hypothetical protein